MAEVIIDFAGEPEFPALQGGAPCRIEVIRGRLREFADSYTKAKGHPPERIILAPAEHKHCTRRIEKRLNRELKQGAENDFQRRRAQDPKAKRIKPELVTVAALRWGKTEIVEGGGYSKHRPVEQK